MRISSGVEMLELTINGFTLNPTLIWDDETAILIDTGMPGQVENIRDAMLASGVSIDQLKAVILTHQDLDHIGSLPELLESSNVEVYAHELDKPYIEGKLPLIKTDPSKISKEKWDSLPEPMRFLYENPPKANVNHTLNHNQVLPYCGGIRVIHTPGHTPGHISLYLENSKTLVAGDSMVIIDGVLRGPVQQNTPDMPLAHHSLKKYSDLDINTVICYHGGMISDHVNERIKALIKQFQE